VQSTAGPARSSRVGELRTEMELMLAEAVPGARLPGERALSIRLGVARMTLRRVVDDLVDQGRLARRPGSGTFVTRPVLAKELGVTSFSEDMRARGLRPGTEVIEVSQRCAHQVLARQLRMPEGDPVVHIKRVRLAHDEPMAVETAWIPAAFVPGISAADVQGSLYEVLARRWRARPTAATSTAAAVLPDPQVAALLKITPTQPCLQVQLTGVDQRGRTVLYVRGIYRGDRYQVRTTTLDQTSDGRR
jgi:GntR family transcriptional regulator